MSAPIDLDGPHWRFALTLYGKPGVSDACLALQDDFGVDVTVLLFALYASSDLGLAIGPSEAAALDAAVAMWRQSVVEPLRSVRRDLKGGVNGVPRETVDRFRGSAQMLELEAERIGLAVLAQATTAFETLIDQPRHAAAAAAGMAIVTFYVRDNFNQIKIAEGTDFVTIIDHL